jgi:hypothetical protein
MKRKEKERKEGLHLQAHTFGKKGHTIEWGHESN